MTDTPMFAGAAVVDITPAININMGGYSARKFPSAGTHDPLNARILVLSDGETEIAIVICDVVGVFPPLVAETRAQIERLTGIPAEFVCIAATHTHSGPLFPSDHTVPVARKIAGGVKLAREALQPVVLKATTSAVSSVGANRRHPDGPIETLANILVAAPGGGAPPVATVVNYACHATILEWDNTLYSADFPGAMARSIEANVGGVALYMQGAAGDINPIWMKHDFEDIARAGGILGAAATRAVHELQPVGEGQWVVNLSWSEDLAVPPLHGAVLQNPRIRVARASLDLPRKALPSMEELEAVYQDRLAELEASPDEATRRARQPLVNELRMSRSRKTQYPAEPGDTQTAEVQVFRLSDDCAILALPGEFFVEIGHELRRRAGLEHLFICGYANDFISYVPTAAEFDNHGYEIGSALFAPEAAEMFMDAAVSLIRSLD